MQRKDDSKRYKNKQTESAHFIQDDKQCEARQGPAVELIDRLSVSVSIRAYVHLRTHLSSSHEFNGQTIIIMKLVCYASV